MPASARRNAQSVPRWNATCTSGSGPSGVSVTSALIPYAAKMADAMAESLLPGQPTTFSSASRSRLRSIALTVSFELPSASISQVASVE
ncbi:hypothetical protein [Dactylosporangium cerinum]